MDGLGDDLRTTFHTCPLCEATCGLAITTKGDRVVRIRGDQDDVFSKGYLCPKGSTLKQLHEDPDRLRRPLVKRDGRHVEVSWDEAFAEIARRLPTITDAHGRDAVAVYIGNPTAHNLSGMVFNRPLLQAIGTRNRFSASTADQMPKQVAAAYVFGTAVSIPVPDLDRTDHVVVLGANPYASNGSLCTAPDFPGRLEAIQARGGKVVVVDPRRTRTAEAADEWVAIVPGTDALLLAAMAQVLFREGMADPGDHVRSRLAGLDDLRAAVAPFTPEAVEDACGVDAVTIRRLARELAAAPSAAVYGRIGTCTQAFGTTVSWLVDVLNVISGNLDRPGGAMFALPAAGNATTRGTPGTGNAFRIGRGHTKVRELPEVMGEYPVVALAEEIDNDREDRIRALVTVAGNPVLSAPDAERLDAALEQLELMVSVDIYLNETTRHADVILPPPSPLQRSHFDLLLLQFAVRNVANYSPPTLPLAAGELDEWEILARLAAVAAGGEADADPSEVDELAIAGLVHSAVKDPTSPVRGRDPEELLKALGEGGRRGPDRILDFQLRTGPYGDAFGAVPGGLRLDELEEHPHGIDLGPLEPRLDQVIRTPSGRIELAPPELVADLDRLAGLLVAPEAEGGGTGGIGGIGGSGTGGAAGDRVSLLLVGRRHLRSNNSWMHNVHVLVKGRPQYTLQVHPDDAARLGLADGQVATVRSRVGAVGAPVEITDAIRPGVVSLPHGWGHDRPGSRLSVAGAYAGGNANLLSDPAAFDPLSGNAVLNGIPVTVAAE